jgi:hypothetical protein
VTKLGTNFGSGIYSASIERSSDGKYLYYTDATNGGSTVGLPIIQYNTATNQKKVIAFLVPYLASKSFSGTLKIFGGALSADGSTYFVVTNGTAGGLFGGRRLPGIVSVHVPVAERP